MTSLPSTSRIDFSASTNTPTRVLAYEGGKHSVLRDILLQDVDVVRVDSLNQVLNYDNMIARVVEGMWSEPTHLKAKGSHMVFINHALGDVEKATLMTFVMNNYTLVLGPKAADDFTWQLKSEANAVGQLFEVADTKSSLKHIFLSTLSAFRRRESKGEPVTVATALPADPMGALPGVIAATRFLRSERGRLDAEKVRKLFTLSRADLARISKVQEETIRQTPDSHGLQECLAAFERIARLLTFNADPANFATWLNTPNSELEEKTPLDLIREGQLRVVEVLVHDILTNRGR